MIYVETNLLKIIFYSIWNIWEWDTPITIIVIIRKTLSVSRREDEIKEIPIFLTLETFSQLVKRSARLINRPYTEQIQEYL